MMPHKLAYCCIFLLIVHVHCWNLHNYGITENYYVSSATVYRHRLFATLPRSYCPNNTTHPTILELPWLGEYRSFVAFPKIRSLGTTSQVWGECGDLQDAIDLELEGQTGRLWILDMGNDFCDPKLVLYNLHTNVDIGKFNFERGVKQYVSSTRTIKIRIFFSNFCYVDQHSSAFRKQKWTNCLRWRTR